MLWRNGDATMATLVSVALVTTLGTTSIMALVVTLVALMMSLVVSLGIVRLCIRVASMALLTSMLALSDALLLSSMSDLMLLLLVLLLPTLILELLDEAQLLKLGLTHGPVSIDVVLVELTLGAELAPIPKLLFVHGLLPRLGLGARISLCDLPVAIALIAHFAPGPYKAETFLSGFVPCAGATLLDHDVTDKLRHGY